MHRTRTRTGATPPADGPLPEAFKPPHPLRDNLFRRPAVEKAPQLVRQTDEHEIVLKGFINIDERRALLELDGRFPREAWWTIFGCNPFRRLASPWKRDVPSGNWYWPPTKSSSTDSCLIICCPKPAAYILVQEALYCWLRANRRRTAGAIFFG